MGAVAAERCEKARRESAGGPYPAGGSPSNPGKRPGRSQSRHPDRCFGSPAIIRTATQAARADP